MANFIGMVFGTLKANGIDTKGMSVEEAIDKFQELNESESGEKTTKKDIGVKSQKIESVKVKSGNNTNNNEFRNKLQKVIESKNQNKDKIKSFVNEKLEQEVYKPKENLKIAMNGKKTAKKEEIAGYNSYIKDVKNEPKITSDVVDVFNETGLKPIGLEYRVKGGGSFTRKIKDEAKTKPNYQLKDAVRYTVNVGDDIGKDYNAFKTALEKKGYKEVACKNYWADEKSSYKGINTNYRTPDGNIIEVQYHSANNHEVKERMHKYYEISRDTIKYSEAERNDALKKQVELSKQWNIPKGFENIQSHTEI